MNSRGPIDLPTLTQVTGDIEAWAEVGAAISIDLPALTQVGTRMEIRDCNFVTSISMPDFGALSSLGDSLTISGNSSLPNCYATDIHEQLLANGWTGSAAIHGNNGTGTCP